MRRTGAVLLALAVALVQLALLPALRPFGVVPDAALPLVVLAGVEGTASLALVLAVGLGIAMDMASAANFGLWTGVLVLAALSAGLMRRAGLELRIFPVAVGIVAAGTVISAAGIWTGLFASGFVNLPAGWLLGRLFLELIINIFILFILRPPIRWLLGGPAGAEA